MSDKKFWLTFAAMIVVIIGLYELMTAFFKAILMVGGRY